MAEILYRLFMLLIGCFWANLFLLRCLFDLLRVGPRQFLSKCRMKNVPEPLSDPVYGEHALVNIGAVKLHTVTSGPENAPLMLMLHGYPEMWYSWRHQIKEFQKDFRVVAVDMRGFGDSDKPKGVKEYEMDVLIKDILLLIEALNCKSCVLVSHDWGGTVAWAFAACHPEKVDRLVVMNIPPISIWKEGFLTLKYPIQFVCSSYIYFFQLPWLPELVLSARELNFINESLRGKIGPRIGEVTPQEVECYKYYLSKPGALTSGLNYYRANFGYPTVDHKLEYPMPVQVIWGCKDLFLTLPLLSEIEKRIPGVSVTRLEESSHWVQLDQPKEVCQAIRQFLSETSFHSPQS